MKLACKFALLPCMGALLSVGSLVAQTAPSTVEPSRSLNAMIADAEKEEISLAEAMPADRYNFAPAAADFKTLKPEFTKVKTFGESVAHIASGNFYYASAATGLKPPVDLEALSKVTGKDAAVKALKESFAFMHQAAASITAANAFEHVGRSPDSTRAVLLASGVAHSRDHYGQLVVYLRMNGIVPPASHK